MTKWFPERGRGSVKTRARDLGLTRRQVLTNREQAFIREWGPELSVKELKWAVGRSNVLKYLDRASPRLPSQPWRRPEAGRVDPKEHKRLVIFWAVKWGAKPPFASTWQHSAGWLGLMEAVRLYDPTRGFAFSTFASKYIEGRIRQEWRREGLRQRTQRAFSQIGIREEDGDGDFAAGLGADDRESDMDNKDQVADLLERLDARSRRLVERVVMGGLTYAEAVVSEKPPISSDRARQIVTAALELMRHGNGD